MKIGHQTVKTIFLSYLHDIQKVLAHSDCKWSEENPHSVVQMDHQQQFLRENGTWQRGACDEHETIRGVLYGVRVAVGITWGLVAQA